MSDTNFIGKLKSGFKKMANNPSFTLKEQLGYAAGSFGNTMGQDMIGTFIMLFLAKYAGVNSAAFAGIATIAKVLTIIADPVSGSILDNGIGKSRRSIIKPFLFLLPFPFAISSILLFVVPAKSVEFRIIYVAIFYIIFCLSDAIYDMSLLTMSVRMTKNPKDRKNFYTLAQFAATLGSAMPGGLIPLIVSMYESDFKAESRVYLIGALVFGIVGFVCMLIPYFTLSEKNTFICIQKPKIALNFKALLTNKPLLLLIACRVTESIRQICYGALAFFYVETLKSYWLHTVVGTVSGVLSYVGLALLPYLGSKLSSRNIVAYSYLYSGVCYFLLLITGYKSIFLVGLLIGISGFPNSMMSAAHRILLADSTEYMEWKTWKKYGTPVRSDGMVFAFYSMANKVSGLWKDALFALGLVIVGYVEASVVDGVTIEVTQSEETLKGLFYMVAIPGTIGNIVPGLIMLCDKYTGKRKEEILAELAELHAREEAILAGAAEGGSQDVEIDSVNLDSQEYSEDNTNNDNIE